MDVVCGESYRDGRIPKINVWMVIRGTREISNDIHKLDATVKRASQKGRARDVRRHAPLPYPRRVVKLLGSDGLQHVPNLELGRPTHHPYRIGASYTETPFFSISDGVMKYSLDLATQVLRQTPLMLEALLSELSEEWTHESEGPGAWTPYQVVGHMTFVEESDWIDRTQLILDHGPSRVFEAIDREAGFERFKGVSLPALLERFAEVRNVNLLSLEVLVSTEDLGERGVHPEFGEVRLDQLLAAWVVHDLNHVSQIVKTMAKQYTKAVGPWRAYLPIIDAE
jgi:DinB family protein